MHRRSLAHLCNVPEGTAATVTLALSRLLGTSMCCQQVSRAPWRGSRTARRGSPGGTKAAADFTYGHAGLVHNPSPQLLGIENIL